MTKRITIILLLILVACNNNSNDHKEKETNITLKSIEESEEIKESEKPSNKSTTNDNILKDEYSKKESNVSNKPNNNVKEITTYGEVEYIDEYIPFEKLNDYIDSTKYKNEKGLLTKGTKGVKRKEIRKIYKDDVYSHTEIIKDFYIIKEPTHEQYYVGSKDIPVEILLSDKIGNSGREFNTLEDANSWAQSQWLNEESKWYLHGYWVDPIFYGYIKDGNQKITRITYGVDFYKVD